MARFNTIQTDFSAGELAPRLHSRIDLPIYRKGLSECTNFIVEARGNLARRPGTTLVANLENDGTALPANLVMIPRNSTSAVIVSSAGAADFDLVNKTVTPGAIPATYSPPGAAGACPKWAPPILNGTITELENTRRIKWDKAGDMLVITSGVADTGNIIAGGRCPLVTHKVGAFNHWYGVRSVTDLGFSGTDVRGVRPYEGNNDQSKQKVASVAGAEYIDGVWVAIPFTAPLPETTPGNATPNQFAPVATTGNGVTFNGTGYIPFVRNSYMKVHQNAGAGGQTGVCLGRTSTTADILKAFLSTVLADTVDTEIDTWANGNAKAGVYDKYPNAVAFFQSRLFFARDESLWGSQLGDIFQFMARGYAETTDFGEEAMADAFELRPAYSNYQDMKWIKGAGDALIIGTNDQIISLSAGDGEYAVSRLSPKFRTISSIGVADRQPFFEDEVLTFIDSTQQRVHEFVFQPGSSQFRPEELNVFANHIHKQAARRFASPTAVIPKIEKVVVQQIPNRIVWAIDENGQLHGCTRDRRTDVFAWHTHELGGYSNTGNDEPPKVKDIAIMRDSTTGEDILYLFVERNINGSTENRIEKMNPIYEGITLDPNDTTLENNPIYMDMTKMSQACYRFAEYHVPLQTNLNAAYTDDNPYVANNNGGVFTGGKLDLRGAGGEDVLLDIHSEDTTFGAIRINFTPNYSGTPASDRYIVVAGKDTANDQNLVQIRHTSAGTIFLDVHDSSGSNIFTGGAAWSPSSGTEYVIEANWAVGGTANLYVDGVRQTTGSPVGTRTDVNFIRIGAARGGSGLTDAYFRFLVFSRGQEVSGATIPNRTVDDPYLAGDSAGGLDLYRNETISVMGNGKQLAHKVVLDNAIATWPGDTAPDGNNPAHFFVGFPYDSRAETLPVEGGGVLGIAQNLQKRVHRVGIRMVDTAGLKVGLNEFRVDDDEGHSADIDNPTDVGFQSRVDGDPLELFTGDKIVDVDGGYRHNPSVTIEKDDIFPANITAITMQGQTSDG
jgi:hypothetical protein